MIFPKFELHKLIHFIWDKIESFFETAIFPKSDFRFYRSKFFLQKIMVRIFFKGIEYFWVIHIPVMGLGIRSKIIS